MTCPHATLRLHLRHGVEWSWRCRCGAYVRTEWADGPVRLVSVAGVAWARIVRLLMMGVPEEPNQAAS